MRWFMTAAVAVVAVAGSASPADACSPAGPFLYRVVQPADGSLEIPTNAEVRVLYGGTCAHHVTQAALVPGLQTVEGEPIPTAVESYPMPGSHGITFVLRAETPLAAGTTYRVVDRVVTGDFDESGDCPEPAALTHDVPEAFATFTTGAGPDLSPPTFAGLAGLSVYEDECKDSGCCGPYYAETLSFSYVPATDDYAASELRYNLYDGRTGALLSRHAHAPSARLPCGFSPFAKPVVPGPSPAIVIVRAVDLAGNEDGNAVAAEVAYDCQPGTPVIVEPEPEPEPEPGPEPGPEPNPEPVADSAGEPDAGAEPDTEAEVAPQAPSGGDSGCTGGSVGSTWLAALLVAFTRRRRVSKMA